VGRLGQDLITAAIELRVGLKKAGVKVKITEKIERVIILKLSKFIENAMRSQKFRISRTKR
jgi:hypothetical protein